VHGEDDAPHHAGQPIIVTHADVCMRWRKVSGSCVCMCVCVCVDNSTILALPHVSTNTHSHAFLLSVSSVDKAVSPEAMQRAPSPLVWSFTM
jgi:hypothetical protein